MDRIDLIKHLVVISAGLLVLFWTLYLMITPLKFALGLTLFLITVVAGELLLSGNEERLETRSYGKLSGLARWISSELLVVAAFALSLAIIFFVPAIKREIFVEWATLELPNAARLIAAFGLNFFPGYLILAVVERRRLGKLTTVITSYFLSMFVLSITGFVSALVVGIIDEFFFNVFFFVCVALVIVYILKRLLHRRGSKLENAKSTVSSSSAFRNILATLLVGLTVVFMGIWLWWMYSSIGFFFGGPGSDMWRAHGYAQTFLDYRAFLWIHITWWFPLYVACFTFISGTPSANAYMALHPLIVLPVLSFYAMVSGLFKDKRVISLATLSYALFSGSAWLYALYLRDFRPVVSDYDWKYIIYETADKFLNQSRYPPFAQGFTASVLGFASLWWMIYATFRLNLRHKFNFFLMSVIVALSYLLHGVEPVIFAVYLSAALLVYLLTQNGKGKKQVRLAALSILAALVMVSVIELSLTPYYEYFRSFSSSLAYLVQMGRYYYLGSPSFYILVLMSLLIVVITYIKPIETKLVQLYQWASQKLAPKYASSIKKRFVEIVFYLYGVTLVVWFILQPAIMSSAPGGVGWIPWYVYPAVIGVPFLLSLVGASVLILKWGSIERKIRNILAFTAIAAILLFFFGQGISFVNETFFYTYFWERRNLNYIYPLIGILMAYALVTLLGHGHRKKAQSLKYLARIGIISFLVSLIILSSVSSTLIAGDFSFLAHFGVGITEEELEALRYLHYSLPKGFNTGYLARYTGYYYIRGFASDKYTFDPYLWLGQYYYSPTSVISAIQRADIRFLYLNHMRDSRDLKKNLFIQQLIKVLPVEFENSEVTIYSIPPLRYPSSQASLRLVSPEEKEGDMYDAYVLWSLALMMSEHPYMMISNVSDPFDLDGAESIIVPYDPLPIEKDVEQLLEWISNGGHLILSDTNPYGMFSGLVGLISKVSLVNCDSVENWRAAYGRGEISLEKSVTIEGNASLRLRNDQSSWEEWIYDPPTPWDLSGYEHLGIWVYGTGGGPIWVLYLTDSNGNESYYRYDLSTFDYETRTYVANFTGWKLHLVPIKRYYGGLDLSAIKKLRIITGPLLPVNILIDEILVLEESGKGRPIASADGIQGTTSIDLPTIEVEGLSPSADVMIMANYTLDGVPVAPFAIQKDVDSGKVTYLNANLLYQSILSGSSGFTSPYEVLLKILEIIGVKEQS